MQRYRVRRLSAKKFRIVNREGEWVETDKGNPMNFASYEQAIKTVRDFESGRRHEPHPLIDFEDMARSAHW